MKLFKNKDPETVEVKGHALICPVFTNNLFWTRNTFVNRGLFAKDWAKCFVCSECTYIFWFWS